MNMKVVVVTGLFFALEIALVGRALPQAAGNPLLAPTQAAAQAKSASVMVQDALQLLLADSPSAENVQRGVAMLRDAAALGSETAETRLGDILTQGLYGVPSDINAGISSYHRAIDAGFSPAMNKLGDIYRFGAGSLAPDPAQAFKLYRQAAALENSGAAKKVADMLVKGEGTPSDVTAGVAILNELATAGDPSALVQLGDYYSTPLYGLLDEKRAIAFYQQAVDAGNPTAMTRLGDIYRKGACWTCSWYSDPDMPPELEKAIALYRQASDLGSIAARKKYADMLIKGEGIEADINAGVAIITAIANAGDLGALVLLGDYHANTIYGMYDIQQALALYQKAADAGNPAAMKRLADLYRIGAPNLPADSAKAVALYRQAADKGNTAAKKRLGDMMVKGEGIPADVAGGLILVNEVAARGDFDAVVQLGDYYSTPKYGIYDLSRAIAYYQQAVDAKNPAAMNRLGDLYRTGTRTLPADTKKAIELYSEAAKLGNNVARGKLSEMNE